MGSAKQHAEKKSQIKQLSSLPVRTCLHAIFCPQTASNFLHPVPFVYVGVITCLCLQAQQATSAGTGSSNSHTDSQPSYSTDSTSAAANMIVNQCQQSAKQRIPILEFPVPGVKLQDYHNVRQNAFGPSAAHVNSQSTAASAQEEDNGGATAPKPAAPQLENSASAGSSPLPHMKTRKRAEEPVVPPTGGQTTANQATVTSTAKVSSPGKVSSKAEAQAPSPNRRSDKRQANERATDQPSRSQQQPFESLDLIQQVADPSIVRLAEDNSIIWCRVKGFPAWPVSTAARCIGHIDITKKAPMCQCLCNCYTCVHAKSC